MVVFDSEYVVDEDKILWAETDTGSAVVWCVAILLRVWLVL